MGNHSDTGEELEQARRDGDPKAGQENPKELRDETGRPVQLHPNERRIVRKVLPNSPRTRPQPNIPRGRRGPR